MSGDLDDLGNQIKKARDESEDALEIEVGEGRNEGMAAGGAFLSYVISGGLFGYVLDRYFDTLPWIMMGMLVIGFGLGVFHANKAMNKK